MSASACKNSDIAGNTQATHCSLAQGIVEAVLAWKPSRPASDSCIAHGSLCHHGICDSRTVLVDSQTPSKE